MVPNYTLYPNKCPDFHPERFCPNFELINIPPRHVSNQGPNMFHLFDMCQVELPISNLRSESERKYSNCTRTIAGSPPFARTLAVQKQKTHTESLFAG